MEDEDVGHVAIERLRKINRSIINSTALQVPNVHETLCLYMTHRLISELNLKDRSPISGLSIMLNLP